MNHYSLNKRVKQLFDMPVFDVPIAVIKRFRSDRLTRHAAALSFSSLLALAPMAALAFSMLSLFASFEELGSSFEGFIYQFLVPAAGDDLKIYIDQFASQAGKLTAFGLSFFLLTALLLLFSIEESFNDIWRIQQGRNFTNRLTTYWAMVSLGPLLMGASLTISTYLLSSQVIEGYDFVRQVHSLGVILLPFLLETMAFWMLYLIMPNVKVSLLHGLAGALVAAALFELTKRGFSLYIVNFSNYEIVYGALSTLPIFLIWIYLSWIVTLIGAQVVAVLQQKDLLNYQFYVEKSDASQADG